MALVKGSDTVSSGNVYIPRERYTLRVVSAKQKTSNAGNNQIVMEAEILQDSPVEIPGGKKVMIGGKKVTYYIPLTNERLGEVIGEGSPASLHTKLGLPLEIDTDAPDVGQYVGLVFDAILDSKERKAMKKDADGKYVPILDGEGKEISQGYDVMANIGDILGLSAVA